MVAFEGHAGVRFPEKRTKGGGGTSVSARVFAIPAPWLHFLLLGFWLLAVRSDCEG
jgi:hypothetical protein